MSVVEHEVSTIRVSGWIKYSISGLAVGPPAHAGGTDFITQLIDKVRVCRN
jgi:hypothetical protein